MRKLISFLLICVLALSCAVAGADMADAKVIDATAERNINIQPAGVNEVPAGISPTTGRDFAVLEEDLPEGFGGMVATDTYFPVLVQHCGFLSAVGDAAPFYGTYADVYYEMAKASSGYTRMCMLFNDYHPTFAGGSRSLRVGNVFVRQEWDAFMLYAGGQETSASDKYDSNVVSWRRKLGIPSADNSDLNAYPWNTRMYLDGLLGQKQYLQYKYRLAELPSECNVLWNVSGLTSGLLKDHDFSAHNHTFKFGALPEGGDEGSLVYVLFRKDATKNPDENGNFYFNSLYQYEEDEGVYYRYAITDMDHPLDNPVLFAEQTLTGAVTKPSGAANGLDGYTITSATRTPGDAITFANVVVQYVENKWPSGEHPYPILYGTAGNADVFMGGKHYACVWKRDSIDDRTVFYGPDGQEIPFQAGRTMIVQVDYNVAEREVRYE